MTPPGTTNVTAGENFELLDDRRVHREGTLDTDAEADLTSGEGLADSVALATDDDSLEHLDTRTRSFDHADVNVERIARAEIRNVSLQ